MPPLPLLHVHLSNRCRARTFVDADCRSVRACGRVLFAAVRLIRDLCGMCRTTAANPSLSICVCAFDTRDCLFLCLDHQIPLSLCLTWAFVFSRYCISRNFFRSLPRPSLPTAVAMAGVLFHIISLSSSSLVEEEHQTVYFLLSTLILSLPIARLLQTRVVRLKHIYRFLWPLLLLAALRVLKSWTQSGTQTSHFFALACCSSAAQATSTLANPMWRNFWSVPKTFYSFSQRTLPPSSVCSYPSSAMLCCTWKKQGTTITRADWSTSV